MTTVITHIANRINLIVNVCSVNFYQITMTPLKHVIFTHYVCFLNKTYFTVKPYLNLFHKAISSKHASSIYSNIIFKTVMDEPNTVLILAWISVCCHKYVEPLGIVIYFVVVQITKKITFNFIYLLNIFKLYLYRKSK